MLANPNEVWKPVDEKKIAIGVFNIVNFENILAVLDTTEKLNMPVILAFAQTHEKDNVINLGTIGPVMVLVAQRAKVPVVVHPDHGVDPDYIEKPLRMGFTSVMFDSSALTYEENIRQTKEAVALVRKYGVSIKAEIDKMAGITLNNEGITENRASDRRNYTDPAEAKDFVEKTGVDCLACSFGTVYDEYLSEPKLDLESVRELKKAAGVPIVTHRGNGVNRADRKRIIANGVRKINYFTYMDKAGGGGANAASPVKYFHDIAKVGQDAMQEDIESAMRCFMNMNQGGLMKMKVATFEINDYLGHAFTRDCEKQYTTRLEHARVCDHMKENILECLQERVYHTVYMIEDKNTRRAYGEELEAYLNANGIASDRIILETDVAPSEASVFCILVNMKRQYGYILGVGSGTLNSLCKSISYRLSLNYGITATTPSVGGFAPVGATLITNSLRTAYGCHAPTAVFGDLDVPANAPLDMIKAGLGDIVREYNCLVNWKIAHMINGEYYCQTIVNMVYKSIKEVVAHVDGIMTHDKAAVKVITGALIGTGMAMGFVGNSHPASGSEHHVSYYWEMKFLFARHALVLHGTKVGLATPGVIAMWKRLARGGIDFATYRERIKAFDKAAWEAMVLDHFEIAVPGVLALEEKAGENDIGVALKRIDVMEEKWPDIQTVIERELPQPEGVIAILKSVEAPHRPMQVSIDRTMTRGGVILAKEICVRYGLLQLLWDLGLLGDYNTAFVAHYRSNQR